MKSKVVAITLLASTAIIGYSNTSFAEACYEAGGTVTTENVTSTLQMGNISLTLGEVFNETGSLVGNVTGSELVPPVTILAHTARFPQGNSFVTNGDRAGLVWKEPYGVVRLFDDDGNLLVDEEGGPCSFWIHETITEIARGTRFFKNVTEVEIFADGYVSNCPTENENYFELSGQLCVE